MKNINDFENLLNKKLKVKQVDSHIGFKKNLKDNIKDLLIDYVLGSSCNFCLNYKKNEKCLPELGICEAYIDKRYI